ncbi:hypothetical protein GJAV_G00090390 [Gymnothorax javanicus]|nr:hypothetical protein GJAV_G00090390 [Gymnothorax javanicus]
MSSRQLRRVYWWKNWNEIQSPTLYAVEMTLVQFLVLSIVAGYAVVLAEVSVECSWNDTVLVKWTERQGAGNPPQILLGNCLPTSTHDGKTGMVETLFNTQLDDCGFRRLITEQIMVYSNELYYIAQGSAAPKLYPVECTYPRPQDWAPPLYTPVWRLEEVAPSGLFFNMEVMNDDFKGPARSSSFYLGSLIPIRATLDQQSHLPLLLLLDYCVASTTAHSDPFGPSHVIIDNGGCLADSKASRSMFLPRERPSELRLQLEAFRFAMGMDVYIHCDLSAWDPAGINEVKKACNFNKEQGRWELLDDPSQSFICSCCNSQCGYRKRRSLHFGARGITHKAVLGPLVIKDVPEMDHNVSKSPRTAVF